MWGPFGELYSDIEDADCLLRGCIEGGTNQVTKLGGARITSIRIFASGPFSAHSRTHTGCGVGS